MEVREMVAISPDYFENSRDYTLEKIVSEIILELS